MSVRRIISVEAKDPLRTVRNLLTAIWDHAHLDGLFLPVWQDEGLPLPTLITSPDLIFKADPFIPVMHRNSACLAVETMQETPEKNFGFVLRPCELRSFRALLGKLNIDPKRCLSISSDCLSTFPPEDFDWRLEASDHREHMTQTALHFAAHGGILPSRYRYCCQFCDKPFPELADVSFELLGIPTKQHLVINFQKPELMDLLNLQNFNAFPVPDEITQKREKTLKKLADWRQKAQAYTSAHLKEEHKTLSGLIAHLTTCTYCRNLMSEECPLFEADWIQAEIRTDTMVFESWLNSCGGCGMCEADCPENYPLFRSICFISHKLRA
jgi:NAD-dependent dihydropyrimidine dehydrogenase PreA subunit